MDISLYFVSMDKMKITYSESKYFLGKSVKELIISLGLKTIRMRKKKKKARYAIANISLKDISNIIN